MKDRWWARFQSLSLIECPPSAFDRWIVYAEKEAPEWVQGQSRTSRVVSLATGWLLCFGKRHVLGNKICIRVDVDHVPVTMHRPTANKQIYKKVKGFFLCLAEEHLWVLDVLEGLDLIVSLGDEEALDYGLSELSAFEHVLIDYHSYVDMIRFLGRIRERKKNAREQNETEAHLRAPLL